MMTKKSSYTPHLFIAAPAFCCWNNTYSTSVPAFQEKGRYVLCLPLYDIRHGRGRLGLDSFAGSPYAEQATHSIRQTPRPFCRARERCKLSSEQKRPTRTTTCNRTVTRQASNAHDIRIFSHFRMPQVTLYDTCNGNPGALYSQNFVDGM